MPKRKASGSKTKEEGHMADKEQEEKEADEGEDSDEDDDDYPSVSDQEEEDGEDEEDGEPQAEITIEFEFFPPAEIDFLGLKTLLLTYLDGQPYDSSGLVNAILKQEQVGSVVKTAKDDDPIAIFTVLNTVSHKQQEWMQQTRDFLASKCRDAAAKQKMLEALDQPGTGLLITERLINSPPKLAPPLMQFLFEEIAAAAEDKETRQEFAFKRYLVATRVYADNELGGEAGPSGSSEAGPSSSRGKEQAQGKKKKKQKAQAPPSGPVVVYLRPEDEFLHQHCSWSFTFPVEGRAVGKGDLQPLRMVMLVDAQKVAAVRRGLDAVVGNMAAGQ